MVGALYTGLAGWIMLGDDATGERILPGITWRAFAVVCALPAIGALLLSTFMLPESPKHLASQGKLNQAVIYILILYTINMVLFSSIK